MSRNIVIGAVAVVVLILVGWFLTRPQQAPLESTTSDSVPVESTAPSSASEGAAMNEGMAITISAEGYSPKDITVKVGDTVTWTNSDSATHNVSSAPHPTHTTYPPLNLGNIEAGGKVSLSFPTVGTYKYHDHLNPSLFGSITVQ